MNISHRTCLIAVLWSSLALVLFGASHPVRAAAAPAAAPAAGPPSKAERVIAPYALWMGEGDQDGANYGASVATAGDVNGDGYSDLLVGAPYWSGGFVREGAAFLYLGSSSGPGVEPAWTLSGDRDSTFVGRSVASAGDVNNDGYDDVLIGSRFCGAASGCVRLYLGGPGGLSATPAWTGVSESEGDRFGYSTAPAGDVDGDGFDDILIGAPQYSEVIREGKVYLYRGCSSGIAPGPAWTVQGDQQYENLGDVVSTAGDVNGDGYADILIGSDDYDLPERVDAGRTWVYLGSASGPASVPAWTVDGMAAADRFGYSLATAGDVNGDGYSDVIVGAAYAERSGYSNEGRAYVYLGSAYGLAPLPIWTGNGGQDNAYFGSVVAPAGDTNGDGLADVIIAAFNYAGTNGRGKIFLYEGTSSGVFTTPCWTKENDSWTSSLARAATAGDVNGDGFSDPVIGNPVFDGPEADEGAVFVYPGGGEGLSDTSAWSRGGDQQNGYLGHGVAAAGDVNGDGFTDLVIGARLYDGSIADAGRAWAHLGSAGGPSAAGSWVGEGEQASSYYGYKLAAAGDVDGDGYGDLLVGAYTYDIPGGIDAGRAYFYRGSASGISPVPSWTFTGTHTAMHLGCSVASAGDVNGDGYADVLIGAENYTGSVFAQGKAYLFLGSSQGLGSLPAWTMEGSGEGTQFGECVASAGDVNRDGYSDVIIGAPSVATAGGGYGRAYLYLGSATGLATTPAWTSAGLYNLQDLYGWSVASAGDVNGDGFADVIVGSPGFSYGGTEAGAVLVFLGSASGLSPYSSWSRFSDQAGAALGSVVCGAGDVNGDGYSDVAYSAPKYDGPADVDKGAVWVKLGSNLGLSGLPEWSLIGSAPGVRFGDALAGAGDTNGDGFDDLVVAAPWTSQGVLLNAGAVTVYLGNDRDLTDTGFALSPRQRQSATQVPIDLLGRSEDPNGFGLTATGRSAGGRAWVRLEWQAAVLPASLESVPPEGTGWTMTGAPLPGLGSQAALAGSVSGLPAVSACHWRVRVAARSPYFPHTPWMSTPRTVPSQKQLRTGNITDEVALGPSSAGGGLRLAVLSSNPFRGETRLAYQLSRGGPVRISVHDPLGRRVCVLLDTVTEPGFHFVSWNGREADGSAAPAGLYFVRLQSAAEGEAAARVNALR